MSWPLLSSVSTITINDTVFGATATATATLLEDGRIQKTNSSGTTYENWAENGGDTDKAGNADILFEWKWVDGTTPDTVPSDGAGTWRDLIGDHQWSESRTSAGVDAGDFTIHIRAKDAPNSEISFVIQLEAEWTF